MYAVSVLGGAVGVISSDTAAGELTGSYVISGGTLTNFTLFGAKRRVAAGSAASPLYTTRTMDITLGYTAITGLTATRQITVVSVPRDGLKLNLVGVPTSVPDTQPFTVSAGIQEMTQTGLAYVAANAGAWMVDFGEVATNGTFTSMTSAVQTDSSGRVTAQIDPAGRTSLKLVARATPVSGSTGYNATLLSRTQVISVAKGTPIAGTITNVGLPNGPAPYLAVFRVAFDTRADQIANQTLEWSTSTNGGTTWDVQPQATGVQQAFRLAVGTHLVRVKFKNINTGEESYSPPNQVVAYPVPKIATTGPTYLLPGNPGSVSASATDVNGVDMPGAIWRWELQKPVLGTAPIIVASGTTLPITVDPPESGIYKLVVQARDPAGDQADTRAWGQKVLQIISGVPGKPIVRIAGPLRLETNKQASFTATTSTTFDISTSNLSIAGEWTLPDGTKVPGSALSWTPTSADFAVSRTPALTYTAWLVGYEATTRSSATSTLQLWEYVWPTWRAITQLGSTYAPAGLKISVMPNDIAALQVLEGLSYTWNIPPTVRVLSTPTSQMSGAVDYGGSHTVAVTVTDTRGNSASVDSTVVVNDASPVVVDLAAANLSKWAHAPLTLGLTAKVGGGHPLDVITGYAYFIDGAPATAPSQSAVRLNMDTPGTYNIEARISTRMGATASKTVTVVVPANAAPNCNLSGVISANRRSVALKGNCLDGDGQIVSYRWTINGTPVTMSVGGSWTYMLPTGTDLPATVNVEVTDNGGLTGSGSMTFN